MKNALIARLLGASLSLGALTGLAGCVFAPGGDIDYDTSAAPVDDIVDVEPITFGLIKAQARADAQARQAARGDGTQRELEQALTQELNSSTRAQLAPDYQYHVGPGDILNIVVYDHPELSLPTGSERSAQEAGNVVHADGTLFYPYIGRVQVSGKTLDEIRRVLGERLQPYLNEPQIDVKVAAFRSQKVRISGEVEQPGVQPINDVPLSLLDAIAAAGGMTGDADWHNVVLKRNGEETVISLYELLAQRNAATGEARDRLLKDGDVLYVPDVGTRKVFVMGEVDKSVSLPLGRSPISLTDAIAQAGGIKEDSADASGIFVVRRDREDPEKLATVYQLDARNTTALILGADFALKPQDVVYVTAAPVSRWNRVISQLLPTVSSIYYSTEIQDNLDTLGQ
ncbi:polysaccharide export protein Wza [Cobetia marina]|jgi:polysaccharide export outer membrane protein|uniref:Polysaccharide export protein n=1 Tax=Cobetia marina TaxID=28258 RepID=A0ABU9GDQ0_COBMA|nr:MULTISPECIES: polysaccharide export protein [Cobetia]AOM00931.1 polysaccharide export protein Wza [Cobetia marina]MDA5565034.1 polysaccharide export protein [Cobetia sp. MMG027]MDH2292449.1 polysaccharide export protein [Cobetia sp. 10Alg 146]MDH2375025.1 polysaccharide export protein [Cobetia sp. 3AK]MDI6005202.1 polysaccharide export protein [Cobetia pacifica]